MEPSIQAVLQYWFGSADPNSAEAVNNALWFQGGAEVDAEIHRLFEPWIRAAGAGELEDWKQSDDGRIAWTILLDQFTRNAYRGSHRSFAYDLLAQVSTREAVASGQHLRMPILHRAFLYLPLEHAEEVEAQEECVELYKALLQDAQGGPLESTIASMVEFAERHAVVIRKFGRFPHRNEVMKRRSSQAESDFLKTKNAPF